MSPAGGYFKAVWCFVYEPLDHRNQIPVAHGGENRRTPLFSSVKQFQRRGHKKDKLQTQQ